ncbi:hypothetical protein K466DRAFT_492898 [Polyporus arcularius HHB13444]|uniref:DDE Tnp4 domain-containing protein n=1 Tax=Polyporus arcularius HHB13444 TaxID=1314778 RepID=A0A5C3P9P0_9APHY|nr:hypothetical protein K466DRAFT_492898 [Polyporus arcularius HHB13444]
MVAAPEYSSEVQAKIVHALCVLHNFIRIHDPDDLDITAHEELARVPQDPSAAEFGGSISATEQREATSRRDRIAKAMWDDYVAYTGAGSQ